MGITIGYASDKVPISRPENPTFPRCLEIVFWALGVLGTGLLIGLGGPFWFNVVNKLTDVLQVARGGAPTAAKPGDSAKAPADQANLTAAAKAATDADKAVKAAADALIRTREAGGNDPNDQMKTAVANAEEALKITTDAQKKAYENKKRG